MKNGFTLIELMIVVAIIGILSAVGVPMYIGYADSSKASMVQNSLSSIYMQQQDYYRVNSAYYANGTNCTDSTSSINTNLFNGQEVLSGDFGYYFCITQTNGDNFIARAVKTEGSTTYTINNNNQKNY